MASPVSAQALVDLAKNRRTYYKLTSDLPISNERVVEIVNEFVLHCPTPYNSQATRVVVLFGDQHRKLWDIAAEIMEPILAPKIGAEATSARFNGFKDSAATVSLRLSVRTPNPHLTTGRFCSSKIRTPSKACRRRSPSSPISGRCGPPRPMPCCSILYGRRWKRRA